MPASKDPAAYPIEFFHLFNRARLVPDPIEIELPDKASAMKLRQRLNFYRAALKANDQALYREFSGVVVKLETRNDRYFVSCSGRSLTEEASLIRGVLGDIPETEREELPVPSFHQQVESMPEVPYDDQPKPMVAEQNTASNSTQTDLLRDFGFTADNQISKLPEDE